MITVQQMRDLEDLSEAQGITVSDLMENAGKAFFEEVKKRYHLDGKRVVIFAGPGNNGGDGFVAARYFSKEHSVVVLVFGKKEKIKEEAKRAFEKMKNPITIIEIASPEDLSRFHFQEDHHLLLIDALLGIGAVGEVREPLASGMKLFNQLKGIKVAVDVPSGLNPDTGELAKDHCLVDLIVTFHDLKLGLQRYKAKTVVVDIGIPVVKERSEAAEHSG